MKLATQDLIDAKKNGIELTLQEAIKKYETPSVSKNLGKPNRLSRTKSSDGSSDLCEDELSNTEPTPSSETANFDRIKRPRKSATNHHSGVSLNENNRIENDGK